MLKNRFSLQGMLMVLVLGLTFGFAWAQESGSEPTPFTSEGLDWDEALLQLADSVLTPDGAIVLEGKILAIDLEELQALKSRIEDKGEIGLMNRYLELCERFTNLMRKVEMTMLTTFSQDDWKNLREGYDLERETTLQYIEALTDSLVIAYAPMFTSEVGQRLLSKTEEQNKLREDFTYRLGVLYLEQAELKYDRESMTYDALVDSLLKLPDAEIPPEPVRNYSLASAKLNEILQNYPNSEYCDDALYNLAYIETQSSDESTRQGGIRHLQEFTEKFPKSPYFPEVHLRLGEYYFNPPQNDLTRAIEHYGFVLNYPQDRHYRNALYRLGWAYYRDNQYEQAIVYFKRTIEEVLGEIQAGKYSNLMEESIENLSKSFATDTVSIIAGLGPAVNFLKEDPKRMELFGGRMLKRMGDIYQNDVGDYNSAIATYDTLMTLFPTDPEAPDLQLKKIRSLELKGDKEQVIEEKYNLFKLFNKETPWAKAQTNPEVVDNAHLQAEKNLRDIVNETVTISSQSMQEEDLRQAAKVCRDYVDYFPNTTETYRINYNLAVILTLNLKDYLPGLVENINIARKYPEGKYHETCATNAVECAYLLMEKEKAGEIQLPPISEIRIAIPQETIAKIPYLGDNPLLTSEILYLEVVQNYLDLYPTGNKADTYLSNVGLLYFKHEKYEASRHYLNILVNQFPQSPKREEAYKAILESYFVSKDYDNSEKLAKEIWAGNFSQELRDLAKARVGESIYTKAKTLGETQDFMKSASEYKRVALEMPDYQFADNALWESARQFMNASAWDSAIVSFDLLLKKAPTSEWADKSLNNVAFIYQNNIKDKAKAALTFESLYDRYPKSEFAKTGLSNASANFTEMEDFLSALRVNEKYLKAYPDAEDAISVLYENAELYLKMADLPKAITAFAEFTKRFPDDPRNVRAEYQVGKYYLDKGDWPKAKTAFERCLNLHRGMVSKGQTGFPRFASFALNKLTEGKFADYFKINYTPLASVDANRKAKEALKKELETSLNELISFRQKDALQAIFDLCRLDDDLARAELNKAVPTVTGTDKQQLQREEVLEKAVPLNITAAKSYADAKNVFKTWLDALGKQKVDFSNHIATLEETLKVAGFLAPDSQAVLDAEKSNLKEVEASLSLATTLSDSCIRRVAEIYFKDAELVDELYKGYLLIPDEGKDRQEKMFFRSGVLGQVVVPRALNVIQLYRDAYIVADTIKADRSWLEKASAKAQIVFSGVLKEYDLLFERPLERYNINLDAFKQKVKAGSDAAYDLVDAPVMYLDFCKGFIDSMIFNGGIIIDAVHKDTVKVPLYTSIDSAYTDAIWKYYNFYSDTKAQNQKDFSAYDKKFNDTGSDLYSEGMDLFESMIGYNTDYQLELLEQAVSKIESNNIMTASGDNILRAMVKQDPMAYGYLLGLSVENAFNISGSTQWKVVPSTDDGYRELNFDDSGWANAVVVQLVETPPPPVEPTPIETLPATDTSTVISDTSAEQTDTTAVISDTTGAPIEMALDTVSTAPPEPAPAPVQLDFSQLKATGVEPIWGATPSPNKYFRYKFTISGTPIAGNATLSADENFSFYLNGRFVGEGSDEENAWLSPINFSIKTYLVPGENIIAIEGIDENQTARGLWFKLQYNIMPENIDNMPIVRK